MRWQNNQPSKNIAHTTCYLPNSTAREWCKRCKTGRITRRRIGRRWGMNQCLFFFVKGKLCVHYFLCFCGCIVLITHTAIHLQAEKQGLRQEAGTRRRERGKRRREIGHHSYYVLLLGRRPLQQLSSLSFILRKGLDWYGTCRLRIIKVKISTENGCVSL